MKSLILLLCFSICCVQLIAQIEEIEEQVIEERTIQEMPVEETMMIGDVEMAPEPLPDSYKYEQLPSFPWEIAELRPSDVLPNAQLSDAFHSATTQIDTFDFYHKWFLKGIDSTALFAFTVADNPHKRYRFAIKRKSDWLLLESKTINHLNLSIAKAEKIQIPNSEDEFILITIHTPDNKVVSSKYGSGVTSRLKQVRTLSLLNINTVEYYLHNVMMGYVYNYNTSKKIEGEKVDHNRKAELQYDYSFAAENRALKIAERENYISSTKFVEGKTDSPKDVKEGVCSPLQKVGTYKLEGNKFILVE